MYTVRKEGRFSYVVMYRNWVVAVPFTLSGAKRAIRRDKKRREKEAARKPKALGPVVYKEEK
jgi:hypothetical protein